MDEHAPRRGAPLSRGPHRPEDNRAHGQVEVRAFIHDDGVVAAELEERAPQPLRDDPRDVAPHRHGPGEGDERQSLIAHHCFGEFRRVGDEEREDAGIPVPLHHGIADVLHGDGAQRRPGD